MFCSVPPPPPTTTTAKSKSKWLNNLRSAKGFPDSDHIDLEQFLSTSQTCNSPVKTPPYNNHKYHETDNSDSDSYSVNDILSELFHMGEFENSSRIRSSRRKKSCRKQNSPKICLVSSSNNVNNNNNSNNDNLDVRNKVDSICKVRVSKPLTLSSRKKVKELKMKVRESVGEEAEERGEWDVAGYSLTEVTVIDTSDPLWKFDKMLYRRNNVWKVRDKRGKGLIMIGDSNKRKMSLNESDDNVHKKKKKKKKKLKLCNSLSNLGDVEEKGEIKKKIKKKKKLKLCHSSSYVDKEADIVGSKSAQGHDQGNMMATSFGKKQDK